MPHSYGLRSKTRDLFKQPFRRHGLPHMSTYLSVYRVGDYVDIKGNGAIHKGMPHKFYHGRTGIVWNVTPRAIGVEVNKQVRNRIVRKRLHVRIEHVHHSKCREDFLKRVKSNDAARRAAKAAGTLLFLFQKQFSCKHNISVLTSVFFSPFIGNKNAILKRQLRQPRAGATISMKKSQIETVAPLKYEFLA